MQAMLGSSYSSCCPLLARGFIEHLLSGILVALQVLNLAAASVRIYLCHFLSVSMQESFGP